MIFFERIKNKYPELFKKSNYPLSNIFINNSAKCNVCKKMKSKFVSVNQIKGNGFLSNIFKNIPVLNIIFEK